MEPDGNGQNRERRGERVVASLSAAATGLTVGVLAFDLYVLATHHLTTLHIVSNVIALIPLGLGARIGFGYFREARTRLTELSSVTESSPRD